jgi:hypothetical protein
MTSLETEKFQNIWNSILSEDTIMESDMFTLEKNLHIINSLIDNGADINQEYLTNNHFFNKNTTPLLTLLYTYDEYRNYTSYMDEILYFLLSKEVIIDHRSIIYCINSELYKILEDLLKRVNDNTIIENIRRFYNDDIGFGLSDPLLLEILIGFSIIDVDDNFQFTVSFVENNKILKMDYNCLPIEYLFIVYAKGGRKHILKEKISILKKYGKSPSFKKIDLIIEEIKNDDEKYRKIIDKYLKEIKTWYFESL